MFFFFTGRETEARREASRPRLLAEKAENPGLWTPPPPAPSPPHGTRRGGGVQDTLLFLPKVGWGLPTSGAERSLWQPVTSLAPPPPRPIGGPGGCQARAAPGRSWQGSPLPPPLPQGKRRIRGGVTCRPATSSSENRAIQGGRRLTCPLRSGCLNTSGDRELTTIQGKRL